jgi:uncharacterized protein (TIGR02466 family)
MELMELFPTVIGIEELGRQISEDEKNYGLTQRTPEKFPDGQDETSANTNVLEDLPDLKSFIENSIQKYSEEVLGLDDRCELYITQSWIAYTRVDATRKVHSHPNSIISGVLYLQCGENDQLEVYKNTHSNLWYDRGHYNRYNSETWWLPVKEGTLFLFPSSMFHAVHSRSDKLRMSLAFNTFIRGELGSEEHLTYLKLP